MKNLTKTLIYAFAILLILSSCKAYRNVENLKPSVPHAQKGEVFDVKSLEKLREGDRIIVISKDKKKQYAYFKQVNGQNLMGTLWKEDSKKLITPIAIQIPISTIESLHVERVSAAVTIPVVLVSSFLALAGGFLLVFAMGGGLDLGF